MQFSKTSVLLGLACLSSALAASIPLPGEIGSSLQSRADSDCNTADDRGAWCNGVSIEDSYDDTVPTTGNTVTYELRLTNTTCSPDGNGEQTCFLMNGQYPGPTLKANWGDWVQITVYNDLQDNGTSIHWHGIHQINTCNMDGANGITECPIAPGTSKTYTWRATQHGTSWYHSHHSAQYGMGVVGTILVNGPTTANYDEDLGVFPLSDWFYESAWVLNYRAVHGIVVAPPPDNILVNGSMVNANGGGQYSSIKVEQGKTYKLRLVNTAVDHFFHVSLDGHPFTIVASDLVPVQPTTVTDLPIHIGKFPHAASPIFGSNSWHYSATNHPRVGQRYDVIFTADQDVANYWFRVQPGCAFGGDAAIFDDSDIVPGAIISYVGVDVANPTSTGYTMENTCVDVAVTPYWITEVPDDGFTAGVKEIDVTFGTSGQEENIINWFINGSTMIVDWEHPTLEYIEEGNSTYQSSFNVMLMPQSDSWYYWIVQTIGVALPHPIHIHGHDFFILGTGTGTFDSSTADLNFDNPVRRDVATLPQGGYLVVAVKATNPGAWLMHCHIAWHAAEGFSMQFVERSDEVVSSIGNFDGMNEGCASWRTWWANSAPWPMDDSGL